VSRELREIYCPECFQIRWIYVKVLEDEKGQETVVPSPCDGCRRDQHAAHSTLHKRSVI
jgi:hypothetical protein